VRAKVSGRTLGAETFENNARRAADIEGKSTLSERAQYLGGREAVHDRRSSIREYFEQKRGKQRLCS